MEHKEEEKEKEEKGKETPNKVKKTNGLTPNTKEKEKKERQKETMKGPALVTITGLDPLSGVQAVVPIKK